MARLASRKIVDVLGAFLRRYGALADEDIHIRTFAPAKPFVLSGLDASSRGAFPADALAAVDLPPREVRERLSQVIEHVASQVRAGQLPRIELPHLHRTNGIYDDHGNVFLGRHVRPLVLDRHGGKAFMRLLMTAEMASENLRDGVFTTKRGLYYQHRAKVPDDDANQLDTDRAIASLANVVRVRRKALGFVEARRGTVYGRLVLRDGGQVVDLAKAGQARTAPRFTDDVEIVDSDAKMIVVIEKEAIASRLAQDRWWDTARCIMVCGGGFPSMSTRELVRKLIDTLGIPAVIVADGDPSGVQLALTYAHGAISTALETPWLACREIQWLGLRPSDFDRHCGIRDQIKLCESDKTRARELLEHPSRTYVNDRVREELAILLERGFKVELDALCSRDSRLVDYLQHKLADGDLIQL